MDLVGSFPCVLSHEQLFLSYHRLLETAVIQDLFPAPAGLRQVHGSRAWGPFCDKGREDERVIRREVGL